jgi:hypothetical protein
LISSKGIRKLNNRSASHPQLNSARAATRASAGLVPSANLALDAQSGGFVPRKTAALRCFGFARKLAQVSFPVSFPTYEFEIATGFGNWRIVRRRRGYGSDDRTRLDTACVLAAGSEVQRKRDERQSGVELRLKR